MQHDHDPQPGRTHYSQADVMRIRARGCYAGAAGTAVLSAILIAIGVLMYATGHHEPTSSWVYMPGLTSAGIAAMFLVAAVVSSCMANNAEMRAAEHAESTQQHQQILTALESLTAALDAAERRVERRIDSSITQAREQAELLAEALTETEKGKQLRAVNGHHHLS